MDEPGSMRTAPLHLHFAAGTGQLHTVKSLLAEGVDANARAEDGLTPIHFAAAWGHRPVVELLLANGADTSARSAYGLTPLDLALRHNRTAVIDLLRHDRSR
jgi:ankyrin repeat protein